MPSFAGEASTLFDHVDRSYRARWAASPIYSSSVRVIGAAGGAGSRPNRVMLDDNIIAFAKPAFDSNGVPEGAHEFIASRLAEMMGIPVPPVGFWIDTAGSPAALSIRAFPESRPLQEVHSGMTPADHASMQSVLLAGYVFHSWIHDPDRHFGNVIVDSRSPEGRIQIAFIDHAWALTRTWSDNSAPATLNQHYQGLDMAGVNVAQLSAIIDRISKISDDAINDILYQIPEAFLREPHRSLVRRCITRRARELAQTIRTDGGN